VALTITGKGRAFRRALLSALFYKGRNSSLSKEYLNLFLVFFYLAVLLAMGLFFSWFAINRRKKMDAMMKNVLAKFKAGISLNTKDVTNIGKAYDLTAHQARKVIYRIYSEANAEEEFSKLKELVSELEKEEPFDDLPPEVKPSLIRLTKIPAEPGEESDKHLLSPVVQNLSKYVDLLAEKEGLKKKTNRAYLVTIVSFIFGMVSTYFTVTAPTAAEIAQEIANQDEMSQAENNQ
jgi:preprotein translocase subunit YajC